MENSENKIEIFTDGSCLGNPGPGGWAAIIFYKEKRYEISGGEKDSTNNRMEMMAIIQALKWIRKNAEENPEVTIKSDSNLLVQSLNKGWKRKANLDLWEELDKQRARLNIKWVWVKAHAKDKHNNEVDALAFKQAQKQKSLLA